MKQSKLMSVLETSLSTFTGFGVSLLAQWLILPWLIGVEIPLHTNIAFALIMTGVSLVRGFVLRRIFEAMHIRRPLSPFIQAAVAERFRQIEVEGWDLSHDDRHSPGELARAGGTYAIHAGTASLTPPSTWPWEDGWFKPKGHRRDLVRAAALIFAEGERFDRDRKRGRGQ